MGTTEHAVVIAGGGPAGMMLAAELALAGVDAAVVERRPDHELAGSRAGGIMARTVELFDQRGVAGRFVAEGRRHPVIPFGTAMLDVTDLPTRHPYTLGIWQNAIERLMAGWVAELGVTIAHGREVVDLAQDDEGVDVRLADRASLRARYLVGCDGGRSLVRKAAGIGFPGWDATKSNLIAEADLTEEPPAGVRHDERGVHAIGPLGDGRFRLVLTEREVRSGDAPTLDDVRALLVAVYGQDFGVRDPTWISRFTDATRQAATFRAGRVLLAGDAAHVHYPAGGQGLSLGVHDAVNLGWKLAQVVRGTSPDVLLDSYHEERHPVVARVLRHTMALGAMQGRDPRMQALVDVVSDLAALDEPRRRLAGLTSGLDVHHDLGAGHPLLGRRVPDLDLQTGEGPVRVFALLHEARPVLLDLGGPGAADVLAPWADRVRLVEGRCAAGDWDLPVLGPVAAPTAVLIRPDGHAAWVGEGTTSGLVEALGTWFGAPAGA